MFGGIVTNCHTTIYSYQIFWLCDSLFNTTALGRAPNITLLLGSTIVFSAQAS